MKVVSFNGSPRVGGHVPQTPVPIRLSNRQEITMTQNEQRKEIRPAASSSKRKVRIGHWVRVVVMFLSGGFIFPHALTAEASSSDLEIQWWRFLPEFRNATPYLNV